MVTTTFTSGLYEINASAGN